MVVRERARPARASVALREEEGASVDHEGLAGQVAARVGAEEENDRSDVVLRITLPPDRVLPDELLVSLCVACGGILAPLRRGTGRRAIHHDPVPAPLARDRALRPVLLPLRDHDAGAVLSQVERNAPSDPLSRAGDDDDSAVDAVRLDVAPLDRGPAHSGGTPWRASARRYAFGKNARPTA